MGDSDQDRNRRYAHVEGGPTSVCYSLDGESILTCGSDGEVRAWKGFSDDDYPESFTIGEMASAIVFLDGHFFVGTDMNIIQSYTFPGGNVDGIISRFTDSITHISVGYKGKHIAAGSGDMTVKVTEVQTRKEKEITGHEGPILSVALDPKEDYVATSSGDGTLCIWNLATSKRVMTWNCVKKTKEFSTAEALGRMDWFPATGETIAIPMQQEVKILKRDIWVQLTSLQNKDENEIMSIATYSTCGMYIATATSYGRVQIWSMKTETCIFNRAHEPKHLIWSMAWKPNGKELAYCNDRGDLWLVTDKELEKTKSQVQEESKKPQWKATEPDTPTIFPGDEDSNIISISQIKADAGFPDDDSDFGANVDAPSDLETERDDIRSVLASETLNPPRPVIEKPTMQEPFQPGSTPVHLEHRFMVWNSVGMIRCTNTVEESSSIDVEFHDTSIHHSLHLSNVFNHTMASLTQEAALLACEKQEDCQSKVVCIHFSSWDSSNEWSVEMPGDEEIQAIALGEGWAAAATSCNFLRIFSIGGLQRHVHTIPGPILCLAGQGSQLLIVHHSGFDADGNQYLDFQLLVMENCRSLRHRLSQRLPMSPNSTLSWAGFSDEGSACTMDSKGYVHLLNGNTLQWVPVCNTRANLKGKSDNYFLIGLSEKQKNLQCIPCKGARYPPTLPRPAVSLLSMELPFCELTTEKSQLEESLERNLLLTGLLHTTEDEGSTELMEFEMATKEYLMKLFALSCRQGREFRAFEICQLMPSAQTVQLAIRYAAKLGLASLVERLAELVKEKTREEEMGCMGSQSFLEEPLFPTRKAFTSRKQVEENGHKSDSDNESEIGNEPESSTGRKSPASSRKEETQMSTQLPSLSTPSLESDSADKSLAKTLQLNPFRKKVGKGKKGAIFDAQKRARETEANEKPPPPKKVSAQPKLSAFMFKKK